MKTRKAILLSIPVFVIVLVVLVGLLAFMFSVSAPATDAAPPSADQAVIEVPVAPESTAVAPTVTYENQE